MAYFSVKITEYEHEVLLRLVRESLETVGEDDRAILVRLRNALEAMAPTKAPMSGMSSPLPARRRGK